MLLSACKECRALCLFVLLSVCLAQTNAPPTNPPTTFVPTLSPTAAPTLTPGATAAPQLTVTQQPTSAPGTTAVPTAVPATATLTPTLAPGVTVAPDTIAPTLAPTPAPPTALPTLEPSMIPATPAPPTEVPNTPGPTLPQASPPTVLPAQTNQVTLVRVTIQQTHAEGVTYYTLDGTTPDASSTRYRSPFILKEGVHVVQTVTLPSEMSLSRSDIISITYDVVLQLEAPLLTPTDSVVEPGTAVGITCDTQATIFYVMCLRNVPPCVGAPIDPLQSVGGKEYTSPPRIPSAGEWEISAVCTRDSAATSAIGYKAVVGITTSPLPVVLPESGTYTSPLVVNASLPSDPAVPEIFYRINDSAVLSYPVRGSGVVLTTPGQHVLVFWANLTGSRGSAAVARTFTLQAEPQVLVAWVEKPFDETAFVEIVGNSVGLSGADAVQRVSIDSARDSSDEDIKIVEFFFTVDNGATKQSSEVLTDLALDDGSALRANLENIYRKGETAPTQAPSEDSFFDPFPFEWLIVVILLCVIVIAVCLFFRHRRLTAAKVQKDAAEEKAKELQERENEQREKELRQRLLDEQSQAPQALPPPPPPQHDATTKDEKKEEDKEEDKDKEKEKEDKEKEKDKEEKSEVAPEMPPLPPPPEKAVRAYEDFPSREGMTPMHPTAQAALPNGFPFVMNTPGMTPAQPLSPYAPSSPGGQSHVPVRSLQDFKSVNTQAATTVISFNTLGASPGPASPETVAGEAALEDLYFRI